MMGSLFYIFINPKNAFSSQTHGRTFVRYADGKVHKHASDIIPESANRKTLFINVDGVW